MLYCTYPEYQAAGGTASEQAFAALCPRASRLIDDATYGRAERHVAECEDCCTALADACCQIIDLLAAHKTVGTVPGAYSVSNDGYSVTFASASTQSAAVQAEAYALLCTALGSDPHDLLYRGCI